MQWKLTFSVDLNSSFHRGRALSADATDMLILFAVGHSWHTLTAVDATVTTTHAVSALRYFYMGIPAGHFVLPVFEDLGSSSPARRQRSAMNNTHEGLRHIDISSKLSYRRDDRAIHPIHGCPGNLRESLRTSTSTFPEIFNGLLFRSIQYKIWSS